METVVVVCREVYGRMLYYPGNGLAKLITSLTGRTTLSGSDLAKVEEYGIKVEYDHYRRDR